MKIILTGATGMVGEGVLLECLSNREVTEILVVGRKHCGTEHPKLKELIVADFMKLNAFSEELTGYDACFFCAGISSVGLNEEEYRQITYDVTLNFAKTLAEIQPNMVFTYVSGRGTDSTESGKVRWARVKGKTENDLMQLPFKGVYNFRPALMIPTKGQKNIKRSIKMMIGILQYVFFASKLDLSQIGKVMIAAVKNGFPKQVLEISDIKAYSKGIYS